jgi:hypothetical protein
MLNEEVVMDISEEVFLDEINFLLDEIANQIKFENETVIYEHMLQEEADTYAAQVYSHGPGFDEEYVYEEWN